jgi:hypothetical protein
MKMVLANPATTIMARSAFGRRAGSNQDTMTAVAGSYRAIAIATPSPTNTAYSCQTVRTWEQAARSPAPASDPTVMSARPPCRSSQRPTGTAVAAEASRAVVIAPVTAVVVVCRSAAMGCSTTAKV